MKPSPGMPSKTATLWFAIAFCLVLAVPSLAAGEADGDAGLVRHDVPVSAADPAATQAPNPVTRLQDRHLVLLPSAGTARKAKLFLFVDGTRTATSMTQDIVRTAARRGYHAISIAYPNSEAVAALCKGSADDDCTGKVREEILTGEDLTPLLTVSRPDAIEPRLYRLLKYLASTYPDEGWSAFLSHDAIEWSRVSAVGHSQGAGHVALLAKRHALLRAVMISGVADVTRAGLTSPWLSRPNATPVERQYGFSHVSDPVVPLPVAKASWEAIGLARFGPVHATDLTRAPYGGSHQLTTARPLVALANAHLAMAFDKFLPRRADGTPFYKPVWEFMALP